MISSCFVQLKAGGSLRQDANHNVENDGHEEHSVSRLTSIWSCLAAGCRISGSAVVGDVVGRGIVSIDEAGRTKQLQMRIGDDEKKYNLVDKMWSCW